MMTTAATVATAATAASASEQEEKKEETERRPSVPVPFFTQGYFVRRNSQSKRMFMFIASRKRHTTTGNYKALLRYLCRKYEMEFAATTAEKKEEERRPRVL